MFEDWGSLRFERIGGVLTVRRPISTILLTYVGVGFAALVCWAAAADPGRSWGPLIYVGSFGAAACWTAVRHRTPVVVADRDGFMVRGLWSTRTFLWSDITRFTMNADYDYLSRYPRLTLHRRSGRNSFIFGGSVGWLIPAQVRELRQLARRLSSFAELLGDDPRPWPERVRFRGELVR